MPRRDKGKYRGPERTPDDAKLAAIEQRLRPLGPCCARCRRGVRGYGILPCGYDGGCNCHRKVA